MATAPKLSRYLEAIGRRKTAVARVRLTSRRTNEYLVNGQPLDQYFPLPALNQKVLRPLSALPEAERFQISIHVRGGGSAAQAEAAALGLARALVKYQATFRTVIKKAGWLRVDSRQKERRKFGLKKARKAPQWSKR